MCDVDGIVADLETEWFRRYNQEWDDDLTSRRVKSWDVHEYVKPACGMGVYAYLRDPSLYDDIRPLEGAVAGIAAIKALGHHVVFASTCTYGMVDAKADWLLRHGFVDASSDRHGLPRDFIPITDKFRLGGDLLIDDGAHNISAWVLRRRRAIMLEAHHNATLDLPSMFYGWLRRAQSWADIVHHVEAS